MGFFKKLFGQDDDQLEYNDSYDSDNDYDDDVDLDDYKDDDDEDNSDSSNKLYSIAKVRVVGFDKLDEADKNYVREKLEEDTHVYLRYDFDAPNKQQSLQVCRHSNILGYIEPSKVDIVLSYLHDGKIGAIVVSKTFLSLLTYNYTMRTLVVRNTCLIIHLKAVNWMLSKLISGRGKKIGVRIGS